MGSADYSSLQRELSAQTNARVECNKQACCLTSYESVSVLCHGNGTELDFKGYKETYIWRGFHKL